jgi:enoyl-CoA hydratase
MPGFGGTQRLTARVGPGRAREMIYTGDPIDAETALRIGLANAVCPPSELMARVRAVATKIAGRGPLAVAASKRAILRGALLSQPSGCELEAQAFASLFGTEDQREGTRAFLEKRSATFHGR